MTMRNADQQSTRHALVLVLSCLGGPAPTETVARLLGCPDAEVEAAFTALAAEGLAARHGDKGRAVKNPGFQEMLDKAVAAVSAQDSADEAQQALALCVRGNIQDGVKLLLTVARRYTFNAASTAGLCLDLIFGAMARLPLENATEEQWREILLLIIEIADLSSYFYRKGRDACPLMDRAIAAASQHGDRRSIAILQIIKAHLLTFSRFVMTPEADRLFQAGFELGRSFGDDDMLEYVSTFLGFRHFLHGEFPETVRHLDTVRAGFTRPYTVYWWALFAAMSSSFVGLDRQAVGLLESSWRSAEICGEKLAEGVWRLHLAVLLLMAGKNKAALAHLQAVEQATAGDMMPFQAMRFYWIYAYYHARNGDLRASRAMLARCERIILDKGFGYSTYHFPWMIPMLYEYRKAGLPDCRIFGFEQELERGLKAESLQLRASATRVKGLLRLDADGKAEDARTAFKHSLKLFLLVGNQVESARVKLDLARADMITGRRKSAERLRDAAFAVHRDYGQPEWPEGLPRPHAVRSHFSAARAPFGHIPRAKSQPPQPKSPEEFRQRTLTRLCRELRVEQGGLFGLEDGQLCCLARFNLTKTQVNDESFTRLRSWLRKGVGGAHLTRRDSRDGHAVRIPLSLENQNLVLYLASAYFTREFDELSNAALQTAAESLRDNLRMMARWSSKPDSAVPSGNGDLVVMPQVDPGALLSKNSAMLRLLQKIEQIAATDAPALIFGETGVGKELLARQIHKHSGRKGLFVSVHPASMTETLFESAFFGHEKGSFTGAISQKIGFFELANHGTLFIDEVGEMPLSMQTKFLRVLQEHTFIRVGGLREIRSDFRLVAATNRDLEKEVAAGNFRQDLFYRLSVVPVQVPPLRMRGNDAVVLAQHFLTTYARKYQRQNISLSRTDLLKISSYPWPGNVRELENVIERAVILAGEGPLELSLGLPGPSESAPEDGQAPAAELIADWPTLNELERRYIKLVLEQTGGQVYGANGAEAILGIGRSTLYAKIRQYGFKARRRYD